MTPTQCPKSPFSPTLKRYHQRLWSKRTPSGELLELRDDRRTAYLYHRRPTDMLFFASDTMMTSFRRNAGVQALAAQLEDHMQLIRWDARYTIGGFIVFPGDRIDGRPTINGARGMHPRIKDRFDLTLECIRRHYDGTESPLAAPIARYSKFFDLFGDFSKYVDFFHLQDLVDADGHVRFLLPFDDFVRTPMPTTVAEYLRFMDESMNFVQSRNARIAAWWREDEAGRLSGDRL
ncbi:DUF6994 family protein [Pseudoclavibacter helvolus]|uniref:DUF6994 family protein n=1 Tax=Pseudoclavibacter helvolus TaxID=255205 RepID=UPI0008396D1E|nr:hypothetical protein [Pseudoclavibacter helvolus]